MSTCIVLYVVCKIYITHNLCNYIWYNGFIYCIIMYRTWYNYVYIICIYAVYIGIYLHKIRHQAAADFFFFFRSRILSTGNKDIVDKLERAFS